MSKNKKSYVGKTEKQTTHTSDSQIAELSLEEQLELFAELLIDHLLFNANEQTNP